MLVECLVQAGFENGGLEIGTYGVIDEVGAKAEIKGVGGTHARTGCAEVLGHGEAEVAAAGEARQEPGGADIGDEADGSFRHRRHEGFGDNAVRAVAGDADAAAHRRAEQDGGVGHGEVRDARVHRVLDLEELAALRGIAGDDRLANCLDIAAGAESLRRGRGKQDGVDRPGVGPFD